jgi:hypothetical protein
LTDPEINAIAAGARFELDLDDVEAGFEPATSGS